MITVFYDDLCGLCSKEIRTYQHADKKEQFLWQSLSDPNLNLDKESFDLVMALEQLHVKDNSGCLHIGVGAFIVIWRHLPLWSLLARIASLGAEYCLCEVYETQVSQTGSLPDRAQTTIEKIARRFNLKIPLLRAF
ncbi:MAG: DUF393 domain-containing protein [Proteobacteria bacterium]|nr:DUF393 domain-containing protein [Pseudomonadota bacterium]